MLCGFDSDKKKEEKMENKILSRGTHLVKDVNIGMSAYLPAMAVWYRQPPNHIGFLPNL